MRELEKRGELTVVAHPQITTVDNQPAFVQVGKRVPEPVEPKPMVAGKPGRPAVQYQNVGWIARAVGRKSGEHAITLEMDVEKSEVVPLFRPGDVPSAETTLDFHRKAGDHETSLELNMNWPEVRDRPDAIEASIVQTTLTVNDGQVVVVGGLSCRSFEAKTIVREDTIFLVRARIVEQPGSK